MAVSLVERNVKWVEKRILHFKIQSAELLQNLLRLLYGRGDSIKTACTSDFKMNFLSHFNIRVYW